MTRRVASARGTAGRLPIFPPTLRALLAQRGVTVSELARRVASSQQTIHNLTTGEALKLTGADRARRIAKALHVSLSGLAAQHFEASGTPPLPVTAAKTLRVQLAAHEFLAQARAAFDRDVRRAGHAPEDGGATLPTRLLRARWFLELSLAELVTFDAWRALLLAPSPEAPKQGGRVPSPAKARVRRPSASDSSAEEDVTLALIRAFTHVLRPWFEGAAQLDYGALHDLTVTPPGGPKPPETDPAALDPGGNFTPRPELSPSGEAR